MWQSVFEYLRDYPLVFSETLHEVGDQLFKIVTWPEFWKEILIRGLRVKILGFIVFSRKFYADMSNIYLTIW